MVASASRCTYSRARHATSWRGPTATRSKSDFPRRRPTERRMRRSSHSSRSTSLFPRGRLELFLERALAPKLSKLTESPSMTFGGYSQSPVMTETVDMPHILLVGTDVSLLEGLAQ